MCVIYRCVYYVQVRRTERAFNHSDLNVMCASYIQGRRLGSEAPRRMLCWRSDHAAARASHALLRLPTEPFEALRGFAAIQVALARESKHV